MPVTEIPKAYKYVCDGCGAEEKRELFSRPKTWAELIVARDALDYQGAAVADGTVRRMLCEKCSDKVIAAINSALEVKP